MSFNEIFMKHDDIYNAS